MRPLEDSPLCAGQSGYVDEGMTQRPRDRFCVVVCVVTLPSLQESRVIIWRHSVSLTEGKMSAKSAWVLAFRITCSRSVSHHPTLGQDLTR